MYEHTQEISPSRIRIILAEVKPARSPLRPLRRMFLRTRRQWRRWWTEERLAVLAIGLGNACLLSLVLWWVL